MMTRAVSGAMLGSVTAGIGLIVLGNAYSAAGETIIENTMFGEEITMKELLQNAALGAFTGGVGDNLHRAGNRAGKKLIGEGAEKAGKKAGKGAPPGKKRVGKWTNSDGSIKWPKNNGFKGAPSTETLQPGTRIDRYGSETGKFVSPEGTPYTQRSLPPGSNTRPYNVYEVLKPIDVPAGKIAPWFDEPGGGIQYQFGQTIEELINSGYLRRLP